MPQRYGEEELSNDGDDQGGQHQPLIAFVLGAAAMDCDRSICETATRLFGRTAFDAIFVHLEWYCHCLCFYD